MSPSKVDLCEQLFTLAEVERRTVDECVRIMRISKYQIQQLRKDPDYIAVRTSRRADLKEQAISRVHVLQEQTLSTLEQLLYAKREDVRLGAAKTLGEWLGLNQMAQQEHDDRDDLTDFLKGLMDKSQVHLHIDAGGTTNMPAPAPGGLLPEFNEGWQPEWDAQFVVESDPDSDESSR